MSQETELATAKAALVEAGRAVRDSMDAVLRAMEALAAADEARPGPGPLRAFATTEEVAALTGRSEYTVRRMARDGQIAGAVKDGKSWLFNTRAVAAQFGVEPSDVLRATRGSEVA